MNQPTKKKPVKPVSQLQLAADLGKLPPQAVDLEEAVLGAIMIEKEAFVTIGDFMRGEMFYKEAHQKIYETCRYLFDTNEPIDILTVTQRLKVTQDLEFVGGPYYISQLTNRVASAANIEFHSRILFQKFVQRELIRVATNVVRDAYEDTTDSLALLEDAERQLQSIGMRDMASGNIDAGSRMDKTVKSIEKGMSAKDGVTGIPFGYTSIDRHTGGAQRGDLIVVAARPGSFKTALIINFAHNAANLGFTAAIFQQEMGIVQTGIRELARETEIDSERMRNGQLTEEEFQRIAEAAIKLSKKNVFVDHQGGLTISKIRSRLKKMRPKPDICYIDYLQLMTLESGNKNETTETQIGNTTKGLKLLAKELDIPIVLLSQLSRDVEKTQSKRPLMAHLKGSGAIEADADTIILLFNAGYYFDNPANAEGRSMKGILELIFGKNRMGRLGSLFLKILAATNQFEDDYEWEDDETVPVHNLNSAEDKIFEKPKKGDKQGDLPF